MRYKLSIVLFFMLANLVALAQNKLVDSLSRQIKLFGLKNQSPVLFAHFDKTVYSENENVWFTSYMLNCADYKPYTTLAVSLIRDYDHVTIIQQKFTIKNGLTFGNMVIPNAVSPGNYSFIIYTNRLVNGKLDAVFTQPVTIKNSVSGTFNILLNPIDTALASKEKKIMLAVNFTDNKPQKVNVGYYLGKMPNPTMQDVVSIKNGSYTFNIPAKFLTGGNNRLHVQVAYNDEVKDVSITLPTPPEPAVVNFYPEGGYMVNNVPCNIGWEVKTAAGVQMGLNAILYEDKKPVDTIMTDGYGMGRFQLTPKRGSNYYVKLHDINKTDSLYQLPDAISQGPEIHIANALTNNTLDLAVHNSDGQKYFLLIHNYSRLFSTIPLIGDAEKKLSLSLNDVPRGLTQLTLVDSLGRPFAERLFFAHYDKKVMVNIAADQKEYSTRQKVNVKLNLGGLADSVAVSIACVQESRMEIRKNNNIESYFYLERNMDNIPARETYLSNNTGDRVFLENVLLIKGWRKFTWLNVLKATADDSLRKYSDIQFKGVVTKNNQPIKAPVTVYNPKRQVGEIVTDKKGEFLLSDSAITFESGKKLYYVVKTEKPKEADDYDIDLVDPYRLVNKQMAELIKVKDYNIATQTNTSYMQLASNEHTIQLREVLINDNKDTFLGMDLCGDYVCSQGYLNCPVDYGSPVNRKPIIGKSYITYKLGWYKYEGCLVPNFSIAQFNGIYNSKAVEFYPSDYTRDDIPSGNYQSTLYWKHQLKLQAGKEAVLSFYTSDITGKFKIIVQGTAGNDVVYSEAAFNVTK